MKYKTIRELDQRIENIIKRTVKHYYTDWKNYDRPKYMGLKGSSSRNDKVFYLIVRECGTWIVTKNEYMKSESMKTVYEYYYTQSKGTYYKIDLEALRIEKVENPEKERLELERERKYYKAA